MFEEKYMKFWQEFGDSKKMVLSTSYRDIVTSRMMSVVHLNNQLYFQTDCMLRKYHQLINNSHVALCINNIQLEGICEELGQPLQNEAFCTAFKACFPGSYDYYTALPNERLFVITPKLIERWVYVEEVPYVETFDVANRKYELKRYL